MGYLSELLLIIVLFTFCVLAKILSTGSLYKTLSIEEKMILFDHLRMHRELHINISVFQVLYA